MEWMDGWNGWMDGMDLINDIRIDLGRSIHRLIDRSMEERRDGEVREKGGMDG